MKFTRPISAFAILGLLLGGISAAIATPQAANAQDGATYYVDSREGCSDAGSGTDASAPLCSFTRFATEPLGAGETLLVARGAVFQQNTTITIQARGDEDAPATIDAYGEGDLPRFVYGGNQDIARLLNPSHVVVRNLDIGSKTAEGRSAAHHGLRVDFTEPGGRNVTLEDISVHDNRVVGIFIRSTVSQPFTETAVTGITVRNIDAKHNAHAVVINTQGTISGLGATRTPDDAANRVFTNVVIENSNFIDNDNNNGDPALVPSQIDAGCPDAVSVSNSTDVALRGNVFDGAAGCRTTSGTAALYLGTVRDVRVVNNIFVNTPNTANPDMVAIDHEAATSEVLIAGNYFADNYGGGIEYLAIHGANDFSTDNVVRSNVFLRNGETPNIPYLGGGAVSVLGASIVPDTHLANNISYEPHGFLNAHLGGNVSQFTLENNKPVEDAEWVSYAARDFGAAASPWSYERSTSTGWAPLNAGENAFTDGDVSIDRFTLRPGQAESAALGWVAPRAGVVAVRGYATAVAGDATVTVLRGQETLATVEADARGQEIVVEDVQVGAGETLRFVASAGGSAVGFTPSVTFLGAATSTDGLGEWNFSVAGDKQGWGSNTASKVSGGVFTHALAGGGSFIDSPSNLGLDADSTSTIRLRISNRSAIVKGRLYVRGPDTSFATPRSIEFSFDARSVHELAEGFEEVLIDVSDLPGWEGEISQLRISFAAGSGEVLVDSIQFADPAGPRWDFDTAQGWTYSRDLSCPSPGAEAASPVVEIDNGGGTWSKTAAISWNFARQQNFTVPSGTLARLDLWAYKVGNPGGCLFLRIVDEDRKQLFVGAIPPSQITTDGGYVSVFPRLTGLDPEATYGVMIFSPYVTNAADQYGIAYADDRRYAAGEFYSVDGRGRWNGPEQGGNRSLRFITYTASQVTPNDPWPNAVEAPVNGGAVRGESGYEPALFSPNGLGIDAETTKHVHIRMSNPDNRQTAYLLFTTTDQPYLDVPSDSWPPREEQDGRGVAFALQPGPTMTEYVIDMSHLASWTGTVDRLIVQPTFRWNYRIGALTSTWTGAIDRIWVDDGETVARAFGSEPDPELNLEVVAAGRCVAGKNQLTVTATNDNEVPISVTVESSFGSKVFSTVAAGKNAFHGFTTRLAQLPAGEITVTGSGELNGTTVTTNQTVAYQQNSCG